MNMSFAPLAAVRHRVAVGAPLPFNVRNADGTLLLARNQRVESFEALEALFLHGSLVDVAELPSTAEQVRFAPRHELPRLWAECFDRVGQVLRQHESESFREALDDAAEPVAALVERDPDLSIFQVMRQDNSPLTQYGIHHSMHTAIVCQLVAMRLGWDDDSTQRVFKAALTMNISMLELHGVLAHQATPPNREQRAALLSHPTRSVEILRRAGITDREWLDAVEQHHELPDGSGYPQGLTEICDLAGLIRRADHYAAKLSSRSHRDAVTADRAGREMFMSDPGHPMVAAMIKEFGLYPPGCFVELASGETGMVVKRGHAVNNPIVAAMANARGQAYPEPIRRDTSFPAYAVKAAIAAHHMPVPVKVQELALLTA